MKLTGFFSAPVRGHDGNNVRHEVKWENIDRALQVAYWLETRFPEVDWFVPHRSERLVEELISDGVTTETVLAAFARVAGTRDICVFYDWQGFSEGMCLEREAVVAYDKSTVVIEEAGEDAEVDIALTIQEVKNAKSKDPQV